MKKNTEKEFIESNEPGFESIHQDAMEAANIIGGVHDQVQLVLENKDIKSFVLEIADKIDENIAMKKLRKFWEYMPSAVRWCIMHIPNSVPLILFHTLKQLVYCGFLPYIDDPVKNEEYSKKAAKNNKFILEWSVKIGKYFLPELEAVALLMGPIGKIIDVQDNLKGDIRRHLSQKRNQNTKRSQFVKQTPKLAESPKKSAENQDDDFITSLN